MTATTSQKAKDGATAQRIRNSSSITHILVSKAGY